MLLSHVLIRKPKPKRRATGTRERLVEAALAEFREHGFDGTDTNKIARRAGFAPQTFYRWFKDKIDVFMAVYLVWEEAEARVITSLRERGARLEELADAIVEHHRAYLLFRRSLHQLALAHPAVRRARARSRLRQLDRIAQWVGRITTPRERWAPLLLQIERLSDAIAEGELRDLGLSAAAARAALTELLRGLG
jgi:AcrR family transcriptional regulator